MLGTPVASAKAGRSSHSLHSGDVMAKDADAIVRCASRVEDRGHKEHAIEAIWDTIRDSRIPAFANKLVWVVLALKGFFDCSSRKAAWHSSILLPFLQRSLRDL
jgi:hypothetical protein